MYQRDYLLRMVEMLGQVLAKVLGQKDLKSTEEALLDIDRAGKMFIGLDSVMVSSFSDEDLIALLHSGGALDTNKCLAVAELQYAEGQVLELRQDDNEYRLQYQRSLHFFLEAVTQDRDISAGSYDEKINILLSKLHDIILPPAVLNKLFRYYEQQGAYAKAEDVLFELMDTNPVKTIDDGIVFYKRLLCKTDDELERGNLPRNEVEEGLRELMRRSQR